MKKCFCTICTLILIFQLFSCNIDQDHAESSSQNTSEETTEFFTQEPPPYESYEIKSYESLMDIFSSGKESEHVIFQEKAQLRELCQRFIDRLLTLDKIPIPRMNGNPIPLEPDLDYSGISLSESEKFGMPWLWFQCYIDEESAPSERLSIKFTDLTILNDAEILKSDNIEDVLPKLYQQYHKQLTYEEYEKHIVKRELVLADRTVTAHYTFHDDWRDIVWFLYDDLLVEIYGQEEKMTDAFWRTFSME